MSANDPMSGRRWPTVADLYDGYVFDLDGTVYLGEMLLPGALVTIGRLRDLGRRTVFLSNNPTRTRVAHAEKLRRLGLDIPPEEVIHSSSVMVSFLQSRMPGACLFVLGETPLQEELAAAGFTLADGATGVDAVIASFDRTFTYRKLQIAFDAIRMGARFFATNGDRYCPVPGGGEPDAAAIIAAVEACTETRVEAVVGKPSRFMLEAVLATLQLQADRCVMTGDRLETDVAMGQAGGMATALVLTGATNEAALAASPVRPTYVLRDLSGLLPPGC